MSAPLKNIIVDLNATYGLISVAGKDASTFLQGQLTSDIREITPTKGGMGAYCNVKGRIRALFRIFLYQDTYYLQLPRSLLSNILAQLNQYAKFSKVTLEDVSDQWQRIGIGKKAGIETEEEEEIKVFLSQAKNNIIKLSFDTDNTASFYSHFELLAPAPALDPMWAHLVQHFPMSAFETWKLLDIRAGIPEIWPETTEQLLPHYLNLPQLGAVSFNKGCYCGQEIIARMEYRGTLKRHLFHALLSETNTPLLPGTPLWVDNEKGEKENVGMVISAARASPNTTEMLIETLDSVAQNKQVLTVLIENNYREVKIIS